MSLFLRLALVGLVMVLALLSEGMRPALAANVRCLRFIANTDRCFIGLLDGEITKGDYQNVVNILAQNHPSISFFYLKSPGGNVSEAIDIGRLFHKYMIEARAPDWYASSSSFKLKSSNIDVCAGADCICASACALIWFGSPERSGVVGLHRPHFANSGFKELSPAIASEVYRPMIDTVVKYLTEMEVKNSAIEAMVSTSSAQVVWYNLNDMLEERAPSFAEWEDANCGAFGNDKFDMIIKGSLWCDSGNFQACAIVKRLQSERDNRNYCIEDLLAKHRSSMLIPSANLLDLEYARGIKKNQSRLAAPSPEAAEPKVEPKRDEGRRRTLNEVFSK